MVDVERVLDDAGLSNTFVREYVAHWAGITGAERVEVVSASDDARLILNRDPDLTSERGKAVQVLEALFDWRADRPSAD